MAEDYKDPKTGTIYVGGGGSGSTGTGGGGGKGKGAQPPSSASSASAGAGGSTDPQQQQQQPQQPPAKPRVATPETAATPVGPNLTVKQKQQNAVNAAQKSAQQKADAAQSGGDKPPVPGIPLSQVTPIGGGGPGIPIVPTAAAPRYIPDPERVTSSEWADQGGPPTTGGMFPPGAKRIDIWPRPPLDPSNFLNLNEPCWGEMLPGIPGTLADKTHKQQVSRVPETDIPFGAFVAVGDTGDGYGKVATGDPEERIIGIAMRDWTAPCVYGGMGTACGCGTGFDGYRANMWSAGVLQIGRIWCVPSVAVHEGDPVGIGPDGMPTNEGPAVDGAFWATSAPANMLAVVDIKLVSMTLKREAEEPDTHVWEPPVAHPVGASSK